MHRKILVLANSSSGLYDFRKELLSELGKKCEIVISVPEYDKVPELEEKGFEVIVVPMERRGLNPLRDLKLIAAYWKILRKEKPSLVITYTIKPNIYGGFLCRLLRMPYAVNITGLGTAFRKQGILRKFVTCLYKVSVKNAKVVFFENKENQQIFITEKIIREQNACLLNGAGVNLEYFTPAEYPKQEKPVRFLFVGRVMREKGIDEVFGAMERLYEEGVSVVLDVLGNYEEHYEEEIKEYEGKGWLRYHGYQRDVRPFIEQAHCFVLPSWHEGMANTNLECAAMARPIITSNIHGCKEAVIEGVSGYLCEKQSVNSLYGAMKQFVKLDNVSKMKMGLQGRKHMESLFDKKKVVEETIARL